MTEAPEIPPEQPPALGTDSMRSRGLRLLRTLLLYHLALAATMVLLLLIFPSIAGQLPVGGVSVLQETGDVRIRSVEEARPPPELAPSSTKPIEATPERFGHARHLAYALIGVWLLMLPVAWVHKAIYRANSFDHSIDETTLILPGVVASIVIVVQHSLALAFALAGIVAGVQFRRALRDTFDALFILVAIGVGIAAGVAALEVAAILTVFFAYTTLYVCCFGDGLESDFAARRKQKQRKLEDRSASGSDAESDHDP